MYPKPKKYLGQNFLIDKNIQRKIIDFCAFKFSDTVLEIGAGRGELTRLIASKVGMIYAIEIDRNLCNILEENLKGYKNVRIINADILKFNFRSKRPLAAAPPLAGTSNGVKVIGNIPYYITTPIIEHLLRYRNNIDTVFITVQKEFAVRMKAEAGLKVYGALSCFIQYYTEPKILFTIKKSCFFPAPKVDSCFMQLKIREKPPVKPENERLFFKIIRSAFNKRRKTLRNSLKEIIPQGKLKRFFNKYSIDANIRPEGLTLKDFANLTNI